MMLFVRRVISLLIGLTAVALAHGDDPLLGRYDLRVSPDDARLSRLAGKEASRGVFEFRPNHRFVLDAAGLVRSGRYLYDEGHLVLLPSEGGEIAATIRGDELALLDLKFDRENVPAYAFRRFPTDAATGRKLGELSARHSVEPLRDDPVEERHETMGDRPSTSVPVAVPAIPAPVVAAPVVVPPAMAPTVVAPASRPVDPATVVGVWTVRRAEREEKDERMEFRADGTFRFSMKGATSEGTWTTGVGKIVLTYVKVDGQPLEEGSLGRKELPVAIDASAFMVDTYRYERSTDK